MDATPTSTSSPYPIELTVDCSTHVFSRSPVRFERWAALNYFVGPNGSGKTTLFNSVMAAARSKWPNKVKILGTGRLGPLEKSVAPFIGDLASRLFPDDNIESVYSTLFQGQDTAHQAFQLLEKRLDLQIRVLGFLRHVFKRTLHFKPSRKGLQILGAGVDGRPYQIIDECHGLKELITILTFLYDDTFSVLGIDEPELHLHPQFQRFLLDELRKFAGDPNEPGKKLIFLVTHSPVLVELRRVSDLAGIVVFSSDGPPKRVQLDRLTDEETLKIRQALPNFHAGQRELLFCSTPIVFEGPSDCAVLLNVATRLDMPLGAAGLGLAPMGGKNQLLAYRALLGALGKSNARFVLDQDAAVSPNALRCLDTDPRVERFLADRGVGDRTLTALMGELISRLRSFYAETAKAGKSLGGVSTTAEGGLPDSELGPALEAARAASLSLLPGDADPLGVRAVMGKLDLVRAAAKSANVHILSRGAIEAYFASSKGRYANDFAKQQALQAELDAIWSEPRESVSARYSEVLQFIAEAGFLDVPLESMASEPIANLVHLVQSEIRTGRITSLDEARTSPRLQADGYWHICELVELTVEAANAFSGAIKLKEWIGGKSIRFDHATRAYELAVQEAR